MPETLKYSPETMKYSPDNSPKTRNTGLVSSGVILTSWGEGTSLVLIGHPFSDGIVMYCMVNTLWGRCFITSSSLTSHLFLLGSLKLNLILLLDQLRLA